MSSTLGSCTEYCNNCSSFTFKFSRNADKSQTVFPGARSRSFPTTLVVFILPTSQDDQKHAVSSLKLLREVVTHIPDWSARALHVPAVYANNEIDTFLHISPFWLVSTHNTATLHTVDREIFVVKKFFTTWSRENQTHEKKKLRENFLIDGTYMCTLKSFW